MTDLYNLQRFLDAQTPVFDQVLRELETGKKRSHWMWFVFPQIAGLGHSSIAQRYAISSKAEAEAYLAHPTLGPRLEQCTRFVNSLQDTSAEQIFGPIDALKFRSSMTLFTAVAPSNSVLLTALEIYYDGDRDMKTLELLTSIGDSDPNSGATD